MVFGFVVAIIYSRRIRCLDDTSICVCAVFFEPSFSVLRIISMISDSRCEQAEGISTIACVSETGVDVTIVLLSMLCLNALFTL